MIPRIATALIVAFWLIMTTLLVRMEIAPERSRILAVPVSHVMKLVFRHGQTSVLTINQNGRPIGRLTLDPSQLDHAGPARVGINGTSWINVPDAARVRIGWEGRIELDDALSFKGAQFAIDMWSKTDPLRLQIEAAGGRAEYSITADGIELDRGAFDLTEEGLRDCLRQLGTDPALLGPVSMMDNGSAWPAVAVAARESSLKIRGESVNGYVVTVSVSGATFGEAWFTQLGQLLMVRTPFGFGLGSDSIAP
jgi:hypothetical protein